LNEEEQKWFILFRKGVHKEYDDENYETNILLSIDHFSDKFDEKEENKKEENKNEGDNNMDDLAKFFEQCSTSSSEIHDDMIEQCSTSSSEIRDDMIALTPFLVCLASEKPPVSSEIIIRFMDCVLAHQPKIFYRERFMKTENIDKEIEENYMKKDDVRKMIEEGYTKKEDIKKMITFLKTPPPQVKDEQEEKEKMEKKKKARVESCAEMGIGAKQELIGDLMEGIRFSVKPREYGFLSSQV